MNCRKAQKWLSLELDGELSPSRKRALEAHLMSCAACRQVREEWGGLRDTFRAREVPAGLTAEAAWADVRRAIRTAGETAPERAWWTPGMRWIAAAAAVLILAGVGVMTFKKEAVPEVAIVPPDGGRVEWVETGLPGASPMVYEDIESGLVIIWVVEANHKEPPHAGT